MNYSQYFLSDDLGNLDTFATIAEIIVQKLKEKIEPDRATMPTILNAYDCFLEGRKLGDKGKSLDDILPEYISMFGNAVLWQSATAMINITPPVNVPGLIAAFCAALFNPNFATDESAGFLLSTELISVRYLAQLAGWSNQAGGVFTFGGTGTNMYAIRCGIEKAVGNVRTSGICADELIAFTNDKAHPCHIEACEWLGLGRQNVHVLNTDQNGHIVIPEFELALRRYIESGKKVACIFLNGGTTNEGYIDPIDEIVQIRDRCVQEYELDYIPHIHVDSVISWVWLFFRSYDYDSNPLALAPYTLRKIRSASKQISQICHADSFGADLHKLGFCPYSTSVFMLRNIKDFGNRHARSVAAAEVLQYGEYAPFEYTMELSRSSLGPISAFFTFELLGREGFQHLIGQLFQLGESIRETITGDKGFETINPDTIGFATLFVAKPPEMLHLTYQQIIGDGLMVDRLKDYNHQFFLHVQHQYARGNVGVRITFSRSFRPFGADTKTGALKAYPTSPVHSVERIESVIQQILALKKEYDEMDIGCAKYADHIDHPEDLVWRND